MEKYSYLEGVNDLSLPALSNANELHYQIIFLYLLLFLR